ncbi:MAG: MFS transporter [Planctomycetes bacterium]|nr:MFS transporter [Planctomycetota bacterium]
MADEPETTKKSPLQEITQPFLDLIHAPRALWGINLAYVIEGMCYFGVLGYLAIHFSDFVFKGMPNADVFSHNMVMVLTAGITIAMFFLGFVADRKGVRFALLLAFCLMLLGRALISAAATVFGLEPGGLWSALHIVTMAGIALVVVGYGMYQPAAYAGIRQFTTPKTAAMGFAMLYALMNLGGWLPTWAFLLRDEKNLNFGIPGTFWVYTGFTAVALVTTFVILNRKTVVEAIASAKEETARIKAAEKKTGEGTGQAATRQEPAADATPAADLPIPLHLWGVWALLVVAAYFLTPGTWGLPYRFIPAFIVLAAPAAISALGPSWRGATVRWIKRHPLANLKFFCFIFALIPVQTLFTYNWLILPQYISRSFEGWIGDYFEIASNSNPILIFIAVPIITALTQRAKVYNMMIIGTFIMAAPAFLNVFGPHWWALFGYILIMTIGEAMWQPRFLQYAAQIAPEGRTGQYMGVAQLPWFLTKVLVPLFYSGWMMNRYCPAEAPRNTEFMWLVFGCIAMCSTVLLILARRWIGKGFKETA